MKTNTNPQNLAQPQNLINSVIPNSITQLSEIYTPSIDFNSTPEYLAHFARNYKYLCILYNNTRYHKKEIPNAVDYICKQFRYILNNQVRYQQRQDNLPPAYGIRFFKVENCHNNWYCVHLCLLCSSAEVLQFIVRCWCERFKQYPHYLAAVFNTENNAAKVMPNKKKTNTEYFQNCTIKRIGNMITEEYFFSNPFRMTHYLKYENCTSVLFGNSAQIVRANDVYFKQTTSIRIDPYKFTIDNIYMVKGRRDYQKFGNFKSTVNTHIKHRITPTNYKDSNANIYYKTTKISGAKFNPFIFQRLKQEDTFYSHKPHVNQAIIDKLMDTLRSAVQEIEYLRGVINNEPENIAT